MKYVLFAGACFLVASLAFAGDPVLAWEKSYDSGAEDWANAVALDSDGNVYVLGGSVVASDDDLFLLFKYDGDGTLLWQKTHNPGVYDYPLGMSIDPEGNVFTVGGCNLDFYTAKWNKDGSVLWEKNFDTGTEEWAYSAACDASGNAYVSGIDFITVKYSPQGDEAWDDSQPYLNGSAFDVAVAPDGSVYVGGYSEPGADVEARVIKYDSLGNILWSNTYGSDTTNDFVDGIAVDLQDYVYFTGTSYVPPNAPSDIVTRKLDSDGNIIWQRVFDSGYEDVATDIAVDDHFIYVVGRTDNGMGDDLMVLRYDKDGNLGWHITKDWGGEDWFSGIASDGKGSFYVAGETEENLRVVKYNQDDFPGVAEERTPDQSLMLEASIPTGSNVEIRYSIPFGTFGILTFYSVDGRIAESYLLPSGESTFTWDASGLPQGLYLARLEAQGRSVGSKIIVMK